MEYISTLAKSPLFAEYDYAVGNLVLLRVSHLRTPDQAKGYLTALASLGPASTSASG